MKENQPHHDCMGGSNYYGLGLQDKVDAHPFHPPEAAPASGDAEAGSRREVRIDPETGESYCLSAIISELHNPDWNIRVQAAWDLGSRGDVEAVLPLIEALKDEHKEVRNRAHEALLALEAFGEPLPVRVMMCSTVDDATRTDILLGLVGARTTRGSIFGFGSVKAYCQNWLEQDSTDMNAEEHAVLEGVKSAAAAVLHQLSWRSDSRVLLRSASSDGGEDRAHLLRGSEPGNRPGEVEHLLLPSDKNEGANNR